MSDYRELTGLRDRLTRAKRDIRRVVMTEMDKAAEDVKMKMRELAPVDTGTLRDSIAVVKQGNNEWTIGPVGIEYAAAQEYGARPHVIVASPGKVLVFQSGGQTQYAKSVKHPGNNPQPYIRPAGDWAREHVNQNIAVIGASMLTKNPRV